MNNSFKKYSAFTFVELMIVIAIIGIMTAVGFASLQSARSMSRLRTAQREVAATIKLAQSYALQGKMQSGITPCGYGFRFENNAVDYKIFYNLPGPGNGNDCKARNNNATFREFGGFSNSAEAYSLKSGVTLNMDVTPIADTEIYFTVPHGNMFKDGGAGYDQLKRFRFDFSGTWKEITISPGGFVTEN